MIILHTNGSVFRLDVVYHNSRHNNSDDIDNERSYGNEYINQSLHDSGFDVVLGPNLPGWKMRVPARSTLRE